LNGNAPIKLGVISRRLLGSLERRPAVKIIGGLTTMELFIFARFHAQTGREEEVADALAAVVPPSRAEPGCLDIQAFRSTQDERLFFVHSRWRDEAAFDLHATLPHTVYFIERVSAAIDHPLEVNRTRLLV